MVMAGDWPGSSAGQGARRRPSVAYVAAAGALVMVGVVAVGLQRHRRSEVCLPPLSFISPPAPAQ